MTETPRPPAELDDLDRRVYELAVQPIPLAEVAVRLGIPVARADEKIQRLCARLGVADRAALRDRAGTPLPGFDEPDEEPLEEGDLSPPPPPSAESGRLTRRALLVGGASLAVLGSGAAIGYQLGRSGKGSVAAGAQTPTIPPTSGATPPPPPPSLHVAGPFGGLLITEEAGMGIGFERRTFNNGEAIDWTHGLFKLQPNGGSIDAFKFLGGRAVAGPRPYQAYGVSRGGRFIWALEASGTRGVFADTTDLGSRWSYDSRGLILLGAWSESSDAGYLVFEERLEDSSLSGKLHVLLKPHLEPVQYLGLMDVGAERGHSTHTAWGPGGRLVLWTGRNGHAGFTMFDVRKLEVVEQREVTVSDRPASPVDIRWISPSELMATWVTPPRAGLPPVRSLRLPWSGSWGASEPFRAMYRSSMGPGGLVVEESADLSVVSTDIGGRVETWPSLSAHPLGADPTFRIRSAALMYGHGLPPNRWLADGSGFVAMIRGSERDGSNIDAYDYAIISPDGQSLTRITLPPPVGPPGPHQQNWVRGPVPSPQVPYLLSFGGTALLDTRTGTWYQANLTAGPPDHLDPWAASPNYPVFALPAPSTFELTPPVLLNPKREEPRFNNTFRFVVAGTGDGLRLRAEPALSGEILANLPDGTPVERQEDLTRPVGGRAMVHEDAIRWIRVRTEDGRAGWVSSTYLEWAD